MISKYEMVSMCISRFSYVCTVFAAITFSICPSISNAINFTNNQVNQVLDGPFSKNKQNEPSIAQNPRNPDNLIAGANDQFDEPACSDATPTSPSSCPRQPGTSISGYYASFDGGVTWPAECQNRLKLPDVFGEYAFGDPVLTFDSLGNAYYGTLAFPNDASAGAAPSDFFVAKSTDGGCHYTSIVKVNGPGEGIFDDKDALIADANPNSPFHDNVYAAWMKLPGHSLANQILFSRSTDGGATWSKPKQLTPADSTADTARSGAAVQVGPKGEVYVFWVNTKGNANHPPAISMTVSLDGGKTFLPNGQSITVATVTDDGSIMPGTSFRQGARIFSSVTVGPDGTIYVAWCNRINNHTSVMATRSTDGGKTWSISIAAGNVSNRSAFFASITADPTDKNKVNLVFQALDDKPVKTDPGAGVVSYDSYFSQSTNSGISFGTSVKISTAPSDPDGSSLNGLLGAQFLGDYITAVTDSRGGQVFAVWTDSRNASPCGAIDAYRAAPPLLNLPNVIKECPLTFGNTDIFLGKVQY